MDQRNFKAIFESVPGLYLVLDPQLRVVAASDAFLRSTMVSRRDIQGRPVFDVFPGANGQGQAVRAVLDEVLRSRKPQSIVNLAYHVARPADLGSGLEERVWSMVLTPVLAGDGTVRYIISEVEDVTGAAPPGVAPPLVQEVVSAKRRAESSGQAARMSEERYRTLFESIDAGFCVIEVMYDAAGKAADYRFLEVNPSFERQTGLRDPLSKTMREHVPQHEQFWFDTYGRIAEGGAPERFVHEARSLMGGWYDVYAYRVGGEGSRRVAVLFNDITERMRAVEALRDADRRKNEFLAMLAHELRNPLAPIRNALTIMRLKGPLEPVLNVARDLIERQVAYLVRLVDDLMDVSRITFGKVELRRRPVDLRAVAQEALATSKPELDEAGHRLTLRMPPGALWVDGDAVRLTQVIANLLNNAARYTPPGGEVTLELERAGPDARVVVADNGIGIPPEMMPRVFDAFMQLGARGPKAGGIGIGLSLARMLTELHGGRIDGESGGPGQGSRFSVSLPVVEPGAAPAPEVPVALESVARRRFLVVDDNVDIASSQAQVLRMLGHDAETASSGEEAVRTAARFRPEVVLLDLGMPGMDGYEVAKELRRMPETGGATLIAQTGWGQEEDRGRTAAAGFDAHFAKPVDVEVLLQAVERLSA